MRQPSERTPRFKFWLSMNAKLPLLEFIADFLQIVSDLPALVEVGAANGQGLTVPAENPDALAQALEQLENDPALRATLGARGREAARERTWAENARRYKQLYYDLVSVENSGSIDMM